MSTKTRFPLVTSINLKPSEDEIIAVSDLYYTFDTLILMDGFTNENIIKPSARAFYSGVGQSYLEMLYRIQREWSQVSRRISPHAVALINDGVKWLQRLPAVERQNIMFALKSKFSAKGHIIFG